MNPPVHSEGMSQSPSTFPIGSVKGLNTQGQLTTSANSRLKTLGQLNKVLVPDNTSIHALCRFRNTECGEGPLHISEVPQDACTVIKWKAPDGASKDIESACIMDTFYSLHA